MNDDMPPVIGKIPDFTDDTVASREDIGGCGPLPLGEDNPNPVGDEVLRMRWAKSNRTADHQPIEAAQMILDAVRQSNLPGNRRIKHVICVYAMEPEDGSSRDALGYYQAGEYEALRQVGMLDALKFTMNNDVWGN